VSVPIPKRPEPDPTLDPFDDGLAVLYRDGAVAGHIATSLGTFWSPFQPFSRHWWVWAVVVWNDGTKERSEEDYAPWTFVADMTSGTYEWAGPTDDPRTGIYSIEWVPEEEARHVRDQLGIRREDF
jgi:hypothetical protein